MISERFTADILANIKDFQRKMKEVDKTIRKAALGVTIKVDMDSSRFNQGAAEVNALISQLQNDVNVNVNGDASDLQRAVAEANAALVALNENSTVIIDANTSGFNAGANNVQRQTSNLSRKITEARIGADIGSFEKKMIEVTRALTEAGDTVTPEITADISEFQREILTVQDRMREIARSTASPEVEADIAGFMAQMGAVQAQLTALTQEHDVDIDANATGFFATAARVNRQVREFARERVVVNIISRWNNYQATMGQIASFSRNIGEVAGITGRGGMILISPAAVPIIASAVGLIGNLGPMIGVLAGSTFALGSAFGTAGIGVAAFATIAVSNLNDVFGAADELKKLEEKLAKAEGWEERNKIMKEMKQVQSSLNEEQSKGLEALNGLKSTWSELTNALQPKTIQIFTGVMKILSGVITDLKPMFFDVMIVANRLTSTLGRAIDSKPMQAFFEYLNTNAAPMLVTITKAAGNFIQGFLSMMTAFGPLATETSNGFLKMSEGFAAWSAKLGESTKFQSFVSYVSENMPKIRAIFGDAIMGIINTFAAFAPSSAGMMTSLQDMMARFKEWSSTLGQNEGFKNFVNYFMTNGPVVLSVIGQIVTFIVNLGIALAPLGAKILAMVQSFLSWSNSMMQAHPWIGKLVAGALLIVGGLTALLPLVLLANSLFSGLGLAVAKAAVGIAISAAKMAASWIVAMGPIGWITAAVIALVALIVANWDTVKAWTIKAWTAVSTAVSDAVTKVMSYVQTNFPRVYQVIQSAMNAAKTIIVAVWNYIKSTFTNVVSFLKALVKGDFEGMRQAITNQMNNAKSLITNVWNAIKSHFSNVLSFLVSTVGVKFAQIVSSAKEKMNNAKTAVSSAWDAIKAAASAKLAQLVTSVGTFFAKVVTTVRTKMTEAVTTLGQKVGEMPGKVLSFVGKMLSAGKDLVRGLINGIKAMGSAAVNAISGVVDGVIGKAKSLLKIKSPSRVFKEIGGFVGQGMANGITATDKENARAISGVTKILTSIAKSNANELAKITSEAGKKTAQIRKDTAQKERDIETNAATSIQRIVANAHAKKRALTVAESNRIYDIRKTAATKLKNLETSSAKSMASINSKAVADRVKKENELAKLRLDGIKQFIQDKKSLDNISLVAEANVWRRTQHLFKAGSKERIEAQKNYRDTLQTINNEMVKASEDFASKQSDINARLIADEESLTKAYTDAVSSRADAIKGFAGLFDEITQPEESVSGSKLLSNLTGQVQAMQKWQQEIRTLELKGVDGNLLDELRQMGPKALNELQALNSMTGTELTTYSNLFAQKSAIARKEAEYELEGMKTDTQKQIEALRTAANTELAKLKTDFLKTIESLTQGTSTKLKTLTQTGKDAIAGLQKGMKSMSPALAGTARDLANTITAEIAKALKIKSPSRVLMEMGGFVAEGLAIGINDSARLAVQSVSRMSDMMTSAFNPQLEMAGVDVAVSSFDTQSQMDVLSRQIKNELSVDMSVNHTGTADGTATVSKESGDIVLAVDGHELARVQRGHLDGMNGGRMNLTNAMRGRRYQ